jgi:DsbC/DsbD-like thiol-disulfide interchange protein
MRLTLIAALSVCSGFLGQAQTNPLTIGPPEKLTAKAGSTVEVKTALQLRPGYHCNSNTPSDDYLIPLKLTWTPGPFESPEVAYPTPQMEKFSFSDKPLSVYTGDFVVVTKFKVAANANPGTAFVSGKLRYQACNDRMCLPPKTVDVSLPVDIVK